MSAAPLGAVVRAGVEIVIGNMFKTNKSEESVPDESLAVCVCICVCFSITSVTA